MKKETEWISLGVEPEKKSCVLYQVAIITTSGKRKVATALCSYDKKRNKFFWDIQHTEYDVHHGTILAYAKLPGFPMQFLKSEGEDHKKNKGL